jgi:ceramide glucosyltransferase
LSPLWIVLLPAAVYQAIAIVAALRHLSRRRSRRSSESFSPAVSVLKPLHGIDPNTREAFVSQIEQRYPTFEIVFGSRDEDDPAALEVRRLQREFSAAPLRLVIGGALTPNAKVGVLMELARHARYPIWVINDSDIKVDSEYLAEIVAPLSDPSVGIVTCLYRVKPQNLAAAWEALGIATDFMPSTLVAQFIGVRDFGLGSTLAFRAADFEKAGGFASIADYLADDYQLAKRITSLGKRALLSTYTVETGLGDATWRGVWRHQLRWARTIRASKGRGYAGLPISHSGLWILIALVCGAWPGAAILAALRIASGFLTGWFILRSRLAAAFCWLAPAWDLYAFSVWLTSYAGRNVGWRDKTLAIDDKGRIQT